MTFKNSDTQNVAANEGGFTLLELILVVTLIGILAASGLVYYQRILDDAKRTGVEILANRFTAAIALIRGQWIVESTMQLQGKVPDTFRVDVDNVAIFLNEYGWPANTDNGSRSSNDQTSEECYQIWQTILQNPSPVTVEGRGSGSANNLKENAKGQQRYHISQRNNSVCRYELVTEPEGSHYFEYNLKTGQVLITVPPLD
ncbi:type II secretion system protein [Aurantivibrio plasticivorans]